MSFQENFSVVKLTKITPKNLSEFSSKLKETWVIYRAFFIFEWKSPKVLNNINQQLFPLSILSCRRIERKEKLKIRISNDFKQTNGIKCVGSTILYILYISCVFQVFQNITLFNNIKECIIFVFFCMNIIKAYV